MHSWCVDSWYFSVMISCNFSLTSPSSYVFLQIQLFFWKLFSDWLIFLKSWLNHFREILRKSRMTITLAKKGVSTIDMLYSDFEKINSCSNISRFQIFENRIKWIRHNFHEFPLEIILFLHPLCFSAVLYLSNLHL